MFANFKNAIAAMFNETPAQQSAAPQGMTDAQMRQMFEMFQQMQGAARQPTSTQATNTDAPMYGHNHTDTTQPTPMTQPVQVLAPVVNPTVMRAEDVSRPTVIYVRVSSDEQSEESQLYTCSQYCEQAGLTVIDTIVEKESAYKCKQKRLPELLKTKKGLNIVIARVDRFSRNAAHCDVLMGMVVANNHNLLCATEHINTQTAVGRHSFRSLVSLAQLESEQISERIRNSVASRRAAGQHIGPAPYGYKKNESKRLVSDKKELAVTQFITHMSYKAMPLRKANTLLKTLMKSLDMMDQYAPILLTKEDDETEIRVYADNEVVKFTTRNIAEVLNDYGITKRGKAWTVSAIDRVIKAAFDSGLGMHLLRIY